MKRILILVMALTAIAAASVRTPKVTISAMDCLAGGSTCSSGTECCSNKCRCTGTNGTNCACDPVQ